MLSLVHRAHNVPRNAPRNAPLCNAPRNAPLSSSYRKVQSLRGQRRFCTETETEMSEEEIEVIPTNEFLSHIGIEPKAQVKPEDVNWDIFKPKSGPSSVEAWMEDRMQQVTSGMPSSEECINLSPAELFKKMYPDETFDPQELTQAKDEIFNKYFASLKPKDSDKEDPFWKELEAKYL